jgi:hypothetical protein
MTTFDHICGLPIVSRPMSPMRTVVVQRPTPTESAYEFLRRVREGIADHRSQTGRVPENIYLSAFPRRVPDLSVQLPRHLASEIPFIYPELTPDHVIKLDSGRAFINGVEHPVLSPTYPQITQKDIADAFGVSLQMLGLNEEGKPMNLKQQLQAQIDRASERLTRLERFPTDDTFADGTIIGFDRQFTPDGKIYHYAGVKTPKGWFITGGQHNEAFRWDQLVQMLAEEGECLNLVVCAEVEELIEPIVAIEIEQAEADDGLMEQS